jgi:prepilin-type N-terminal cleavage/methylation domain-containing protein
VREFERGFTLVETVVTVAILAVLLAAGGVWLLGMRPGALTHATSDYDAALASARAVAETSGNGATLVFAPRDGGEPGFTLRAYSGRPVSAGAVKATNAMPGESDAAVEEATLGKPPFAIFIGASGHVSGKGPYPTIAANGAATFDAIVTEPACPASGFVLTFTGPQGATATRALPCTPSASDAPSGPSMPNPSPTPNVPLLTPTSLIYHWPADAEQTFVATEWGYTHWFASTTGFECGAGVATYPNVLPKPYSPPYTKAEGDAAPSPPPQEPFSYPNSGGASMNDAPATFQLDPGAAGLCTPAVSDDYDQVAQTSVVVMGWLTAAYKGKAYTHLTAPSLVLPASTLAKKGATVTLPLSKTYDDEALQLAVTLDAACSPYVTADAEAGTTPAKPSARAATASITLSLVTMPKSKIDCGGVIYDQYPGSQLGEGVPFNVTIVPEEPLSAWPPAEQVASNGGSIGTVAYDANDPIDWLNRLAGGGAAIAAQPCYARAFQGTNFTNAIPNYTLDDANGNILVQTDSAGCILDKTGTPINGGAVATEPGFTGNFAYDSQTCGSYLQYFANWLPLHAGNGPGGEMIPFSGGSTTPTYCTMELVGDTRSSPLQTPAPIAVQVDGCMAAGGTVPVGGSCTFVLSKSGDPPTCPDPGTTVDGTDYGLIAQFDAAAGSYGTLKSNGNGSYTFTRTSAGFQIVDQEVENWTATGGETPCIRVTIGWIGYATYY